MNSKNLGFLKKKSGGNLLCYDFYHSLFFLSIKVNSALWQMCLDLLTLTPLPTFKAVVLSDVL